MAPNRKSSQRRLKDMSEPIAADEWAPDLPAEDPPWEDVIPLGETVRFRQVLHLDVYERLVEWAVVQERLVEARWQRVAVYDVCHSHVHVHFYDRWEVEFEKKHIHDVRTYADVEAGLQYAVERVTMHWGENERRSDRGQ